MTPTLPQPLVLPSDFDPASPVLTNKAILITGASRGLGQAIARHCAAAGAQTILLARDVKALEKLADDLLDAGFLEPVLVPCNLEAATLEHYEDIVALLHERFGRLDGLVLNAGMLGELSPLANYDPTVWARVFQVNLHSPFLLTRTCLPLLEASPHGRIVCVSSAVGRQGRAYWGAYAASKFALEGMMQVLADEVSSAGRISVNSVNPGRCRTRMRAQAYPAENAELLPLPELLAPYFTYLLSDAANLLNGRQFNLQ